MPLRAALATAALAALAAGCAPQPATRVPHVYAAAVPGRPVSAGGTGSLCASTCGVFTGAWYGESAADVARDERALASYGRQFGSPAWISAYLAFGYWPDQRGELAWYARAYRKEASRVIWSLPMLPSRPVHMPGYQPPVPCPLGGVYRSRPWMYVPAASSLEAEARGADDGHWAAAAREMMDLHLASPAHPAWIRLGWEENGWWFAWSQGTCPRTDRECFAEAYRRIVTAMRSVSPRSFRFQWTTMPGWANPMLSWPGRAYVDAVGQDSYDWDGSLACYPARHVIRGENRLAVPDYGAAWRTLAAGPWGLDWTARFAARQHLPIALGEWGLDHHTYGGGDDPSFITNMLTWMRTHRVMDAIYWQFGPDHLGSPGVNPRASLAYGRLTDAGRRKLR